MGNRSYTLYNTGIHPCSYLQDRDAVTQFVDPHRILDAPDWQALAYSGFRRSGSHWYRPRCPSCQACIPLRLPVSSFEPSRQQRRTWTRNQNLAINITEDISSGEHYALYERYINARHCDGDMYPASREQYDSFLALPMRGRDPAQDGLLPGEPSTATIYLEFRKGHQLMGVAVTDTLPQALSAVYTFYDPDENRRGLGVFSVLCQIELARKLGLRHLYLGYWIAQSQKMNYKAQYHPHEVLLGNQWQWMD